MSGAQAWNNSRRASSALSLPALSEIFNVSNTSTATSTLEDIPANAHLQVLSGTHTDSRTLGSVLQLDGMTRASSSEHASQSLHGNAAHPPQCECINSPLAFRRARLSATPTDVPASTCITLHDVVDAIVSKAPCSKVSHVHSGEAVAAVNLISIQTPLDFGKGFGVGVPSFIIVDCFEECVSLAVEMLASQSDQSRGAVVLVLLAPATTIECSSAIEKVPYLVKYGADDIIVLPMSATEAHMHLSISVSLAQAQACTSQRANLKGHLQKSKKQCHKLYWEDAHEMIPGLPQVQPNLAEVHSTRVGRIKLVRKLGHGAHGDVHVWEDHVEGYRGAVKVIAKSRINSKGQVKDIAKEISVLRRLKHEHVVAFNAAVHGMQYLYLFMEMAGAHNLFNKIRVEGPHGLPMSCVEDLLSQIAAGVAYCHESNIAHCDLKPENIVISVSGCVKLVDFGHAVYTNENLHPLQSPLGTMPFIAPEVMCLKQNWTPTAADVWSLGAILVEMLCGNNAFENLLSWGEFDLMSRSQLVNRALDVKLFFAKDATHAHTAALAEIFGMCRERPAAILMHLLGEMLVFEPENRIDAGSICSQSQLQANMVGSPVAGYCRGSSFV